MGASQLAGSPSIPEWDIPDPQFPSVALINWTTGEGEIACCNGAAHGMALPTRHELNLQNLLAGNPRYWALKLLIEEVGGMHASTHATAAHMELCRLRRAMP